MYQLRSDPGIPGSRLVGVAGARPAGVHTADELAAPFGKDGEWITKRTGIRRLRRLDPAESLVSLAVSAGECALRRARANGLASSADVVITASCSSAAEVGRAVASALSPDAVWTALNSACSGFGYALAAADSLIRTQAARVVLVVAAEQMSRILDPTDLGTSIIFGDGAGAAVIAAAKSPDHVGPVVYGSDGGDRALIQCDTSGLLRMEGRSVFRWAVDTVPAQAREACRRAGVAVDEIGLFVPHQANLRIIESIRRSLGLRDAVIADDIVESGNTSAASIPLAIDAALTAEPALHGRLALLAGFGAGLSYTAQVVRLPDAGTTS